jgi:hypothetical protein
MKVRRMGVAVLLLACGREVAPAEPEAEHLDASCDDDICEDSINEDSDSGAEVNECAFLCNPISGLTDAAVIDGVASGCCAEPSRANYCCFVGKFYGCSEFCCGEFYDCGP